MDIKVTSIEKNYMITLSCLTIKELCEILSFILKLQDKRTYED